MPKLVFARLLDATHRMPHPFRPNTDFPAEGQTIDREDPVWMQLVNDGSLIVDPAPDAPGKARKPDRASRLMARPAGAPGGKAADAAREA